MTSCLPPIVRTDRIGPNGAVFMTTAEQIAEAAFEYSDSRRDAIAELNRDLNRDDGRQKQPGFYGAMINDCERSMIDLARRLMVICERSAGAAP